MSLGQAKVPLREAALRRLEGEPATAAESEALQAQLLSLRAFAVARVVSLYVPLRGEPLADRLWAAAADKRVVCPAMGARGPELRSVDRLTQMVRTRRGFFEPPEGPSVPPAEVDVFVVPGLAFDAAGIRLGRGGGYYDRLLAARAPAAVVVGLALERWLVERLPREPHDVPMTALATEARVLQITESAPAL